VQAVEQKRKADEITAVLYPNDATEEGKELRLKQQFFFVSASLQDTIARYLVRCCCLWRPRLSRAGTAGTQCLCAHGESDGMSSQLLLEAVLRGVGVQGPHATPHQSRALKLLIRRLPVQEKHSDLSGLPEKATFQMNDTHPTIAGASSAWLPAVCLTDCLSTLCSAPNEPPARMHSTGNASAKAFCHSAVHGLICRPHSHLPPPPSAPLLHPRHLLICCVQSRS